MFIFTFNNTIIRSSPLFLASLIRFFLNGLFIYKKCFSSFFLHAPPLTRNGCTIFYSILDYNFMKPSSGIKVSIFNILWDKGRVAGSDRSRKNRIRFGTINNLVLMGGGGGVEVTPKANP